MNIVWNKYKSLMHFKDLLPGDAFKFGEHLYIKTLEGENKRQATRLFDGKVVYIDDATQVQKEIAEVTVL